MRASAKLALAAAVIATAPAWAADVVAPDARLARDVSTLTSREAILADQTAAARASARWRLRALYRLAVAGEGLDGATRARALDAGARALARDLGEARSLERERAELGAEREALAAAARVEEGIGAPPAFALPAPGPVVARFGVAPDRETGLLVARAGVRLAVAPRATVRAPMAGVVARIATEPEGTTVVLDGGEGWTAFVGGLADVDAGLAEGQPVAAGERLGTGPAGAPAAITFEVWRGRRPVDPLLLLRAPPGPRAPAAAPAVPSASAALAAPPALP